MKKVLSFYQWETRVADYFGLAIACKMSHPAMLDRRDTYIFSELNRKYGTRNVYCSYTRGYVAGLIAARFTDLYKNHLEFCYDVGGILYSTHKESIHAKVEKFYGTPDVQKLNDSAGSHYWTGSDKPF